jgi:succinate-semialdehyde dehydrogenase
MTAFTSCNPATGKVVFSREAWPHSHLASTVSQLRSARKTWSALSVEQRASRMLVLAEALTNERQALAACVTQEVGKRTAECLAEIDKSVQLIRYYANLAPSLLQALSIPTQASKSAVAFEPLGLVLAIMPWNYPVWQVLRFAVPALMAGNACLVKPAPVVAQSTQKLLDCIHQAHLEVLDIAWIDHDQVEEAISLADAVAFTGSTSTGRTIASLAGRHLKKTVLELGGSNPFIVLADAWW